MVTTSTVTTTNDPPQEFLPYLERLRAVGVEQLNVCKNTYVVYVTLPSGAGVIAEGTFQVQALDALCAAVDKVLPPPEVVPAPTPAPAAP